MMIRAGILQEKEEGKTMFFQGEERAYVRCVIADQIEPTRRFVCRILNQAHLPFQIGEHITVGIQKVVTERQSGTVRFDCILLDSPQ
ncbi:hypothetical protein EI42_00952 [Thermosporothrix hazakensis]|jgi:hypothetical protein|uniref:Uncharacterized protein n=2 Tax=Thermosporothrix TaxID=768650 RepID=A0A326USB5_THEHA|nr:hypothetical protein [Thermosporothrix hazakensis]PZW36769.1 hypothetical protein EI42_00952 [Thermosporothrix hazakensis]BBH89236.1 hypothetical protein KTC_39870 [Thermosporothrix sp. COM3]GCE47419.1 hypothetical protein KTH_22880 [Thermosporothrix hazakensis]